MIRLVELHDADFDWFAGNAESTRPGLELAHGGVDTIDVLDHVRALTARVHAAGSCGSWMMLHANLVVGLCGYHGAPRDGVVEIGYSVAAACRKRGYGTAAVRELLVQARMSGVAEIQATTSAEIYASERVLERNGFVRRETFDDPKDGAMTRWRRKLDQPPAQ